MIFLHIKLSNKYKVVEEQCREVAKDTKMNKFLS